MHVIPYTTNRPLVLFLGLVFYGICLYMVYRETKAQKISRNRRAKKVK